jgi:hypothetical protein
VLENSCQSISEIFDGLKKIVKQEKKITFLTKKLDTTKNQISDIESGKRDTNTGDGIQKLQEYIIDLQCRSMKNNLIFTNIIEDLKMLRPNCGNLFLKCWESNIISSLVTFIALGRGHTVDLVQLWHDSYTTLT